MMLIWKCFLAKTNADKIFGQADPNKTFPIEGKGKQRLCFLKNIVNNPNIIVGDYTYYDDPDDVKNFNHNVLYHFDFIGDKLIVGKFCQIASGARFIMNGANHAMNGFQFFHFVLLAMNGATFLLRQSVKGTQ